MAIEIISGFKVYSKDPIDDKFVFSTIALRNALDINVRYFGLICSVTSDTEPSNNSTYHFKKGKVDDDLNNNENWEKVGSGAGAIDSGFISRDESTISFDKATNTLHLTATGDNYYFVSPNGTEYKKASDSYKITEVVGVIYIYYDDDGVMHQVANFNRDEYYEILLITLPIAIIYWTGSKVSYAGDCRKTQTSTGLWIKNFFDVAIKRLTGVVISGVTYGTGNNNADARFMVSSGQLILTDAKYDFDTRQTTDVWNIIYQSPVNSTNILIDAVFPVIRDTDIAIGTTNRIVFNNNGVPTTITSGRFMWYFMSVNNAIYQPNRANMFMGNQQYTSINSANNALNSEVLQAELSIKIQQGVTLVYGVLYQCNNTYTNSCHSRIVSVVELHKEGTYSTAIPAIPEELINGSDASSLHNHASITMKWVGEWVAGTYAKNDVVSHGSLTMVANKSTSLEPSVTSTDWDLVSNDGVLPDIPLDDDVLLSDTITATIAVGGVNVGKSFSTTDSIRDIFLSLIAPYVKPSLSSININPAGPVEVGTIITIVNALVYWVNDSTNAAPISCSIDGPGFGPFTATSSPQVINAVPETTVTKTTDTGQTFILHGSDKNGIALPSVYKDIRWQFMFCFGGDHRLVTDTISAQAVIENLTDSALASGKARLVTCNVNNSNVNNYTYISYASKYGLLSTISLNGNLDVLGAFTDLGNFSYTNTKGHTESYKVYKSNAKGAFSDGDKLTIS